MLNIKESAQIKNLTITINQAENINSMQKEFLRGCKLLIAFDKATFFLAEKNNDDYTLINPIGAGTDASFIDKYRRYYHDIDYANSVLELQSNKIYRDSDIMEKGLLKETIFYKYFLLPNKLPYAAGMIIAKDDRLLGEVTFFRSELQGDFSKHDLSIMKVLLDHLTNRLLQLSK